MRMIVLDIKKWNDLQKKATMVHLGKETTTRRGESVLVCPE